MRNLRIEIRQSQSSIEDDYFSSHHAVYGCAASVNLELGVPMLEQFVHARMSESHRPAYLDLCTLMQA
jgi:hypothetical protein